MTDGDTPSAEAIADALDVDEATLQRCLSQHPELVLAHVVAFTDPADLDGGFRGGVIPSDVFYTRRVSAYDRDREGSRQTNRLRQEATPKDPLSGRVRLGTGVFGSFRTSFLSWLRQRVCASPGSGAYTLPEATSSRRRASDALK